MPKPYTFPTIYDDLKTLSISFLTKHGYLKLNNWQGGTVTWSRNGNKTGSISIQVNTKSDEPYIELDYNCNDNPINYKVQLVSAPSNLGKGVVWYFVCPNTAKKCRKLYSKSCYFKSRTAINESMYETQIQSKKNRALDKMLGAYLQKDKLHEQLNQKHFQRYYAGKPTKQYLRITKLLQQAAKVSYRDFERALMS